MESLCTVGSDDRLCTVRVGILSLNTPTHQGAPVQCVIADLLFLFFFFFFLTWASLSCIWAAGEGKCLCAGVRTAHVYTRRHVHRMRYYHILPYATAEFTQPIFAVTPLPLLGGGRLGFFVYRASRNKKSNEEMRLEPWYIVYTLFLTWFPFRIQSRKLNIRRSFWDATVC